MRKLIVGFAAIFVLAGVVFVCLPLGTLAILPIGLALVFGLIALKMSDDVQKRVPKIILIIAAVALAIVIGKEAFVKDEVDADRAFEEKKIESEIEAKKELEEIDALEGLE